MWDYYDLELKKLLSFTKFKLETMCMAITLKIK